MVLYLDSKPHDCFFIILLLDTRGKDMTTQSTEDFSFEETSAENAVTSNRNLGEENPNNPSSTTMISYSMVTMVISSIVTLIFLSR